MTVSLSNKSLIHARDGGNKAKEGGRGVDKRIILQDQLCVGGYE